MGLELLANHYKEYFSNVQPEIKQEEELLEEKAKVMTDKINNDAKMKIVEEFVL